MIKRICDRCENEIKSNYWTIDIYQHEDYTGRVSATGAINNINQNTNKMLNRQKEYCEDCINQIKDSIERGNK